MPNQWRRIVAVLANADQRRALADLITEHEAELSDRRRERALAQLIEAGLAINTDNGPRPDTQVLTDLLATDPPAPRTGLERYIQGGRLIQYPSNPSERLDVLAWLADQVIIDGQEFSEREITLRLAQHVDDPASFRRYLVDSGLVARDTSGTTYTRAVPEP